MTGLIKLGNRHDNVFCDNYKPISLFNGENKIVQEVKHFIKLPPFAGNQIAFENFALV